MQVLRQSHGRNYSLYNGDSIEVIRGLPDNSIDLTLFSPPFSQLYLYSASLRDMGNVADDAQFFAQFEYLIPELFRVTVPGRWCVLHVKHLPLFHHRDGSTGLRQFPEEICRRMTGEATEYLTAQLDALTGVLPLLSDRAPVEVKIKDLEKELLWQRTQNWIFHGKTTIWKDPKIERERTNNVGLLHGQLCKDSTVSRPGMAEFIYFFRKWDESMDGISSVKPVSSGLVDDRDRSFKFSNYIGENPPVGCQGDREFSIHTWRKYASPVWDDIRQTEVLNAKKLKGKKREGHICPFQLDVCDRIIELGSNPGDTVLDPFNGIGSTGRQALKAGRKYVGIELNPEYFDIANEFLSAEENAAQLEIPQTA